MLVACAVCMWRARADVLLLLRQLMPPAAAEAPAGEGGELVEGMDLASSLSSATEPIASSLAGHVRVVLHLGVRGAAELMIEASGWRVACA